MSFKIIIRRNNNQNANVKKLIEWLLTEEGQTMIETCGYVGVAK